MSKTLNLVSKEVSECKKCSLAADRKQPVFGTGSVSADLMLIGEGPGAEAVSYTHLTLPTILRV